MAQVDEANATVEQQTIEAYMSRDKAQKDMAMLRQMRKYHKEAIFGMMILHLQNYHSDVIRNNLHVFINAKRIF